MEIIAPLRRRVHVSEASRLRTDTDSVYSVVFRRVYEGVPFCYCLVTLPLEVGELLTSAEELARPGVVSDATIIGLLDEVLAVPIAEGHQSITVGMADEHMAAQLGCSLSAPLLRIDRLYVDLNEKPIELAINHFLPEHYSYRIRLRRST